MDIHAIQTGSVQITRNWRIGHGAYLPRLARTLLDTQKTDWLPVLTWVIEHPEGLIVVDTGIPADANKTVYFPPFMPLIQRAASFQVTPGDEIGGQMMVHGWSPDDVRWVVLTHLHQDHDGGLHWFPQAEFIVA
ncbi:MAG: MBL fold metallo-hydrolase, partial [Anaerolineae bacterium]|nr:MBL fold metallo-hydrolase [Anaerolineae bacterium]